MVSEDQKSSSHAGKEGDEMTMLGRKSSRGISSSPEVRCKESSEDEDTIRCRRMLGFLWRMGM